MPTRDEAWTHGTPCWADCQVDDTEKAREFYSALFGWTIDAVPGEAGGYLMAFKGGKAAAGIGPKPEGMQMPSAWTSYIAATSADDVQAKIEKAGGQVFAPAFDVLDVGRMLIAGDTSGAAFGVWEAKAHIGAQVYNEDGALCWNELHTKDYDGAKKFYAEVFDYQFTEMGDGTTFSYTTFALPGGTDGVGGMYKDNDLPEGMPPYWLAWFQSDDVDATLAKATELGATKLMGPDDSPFGRMIVVQAPQGEVFGVIDPTTTSGEPPAGS